jgi:glucose-1-phosphate cytidylyltransferase
MKVVILCGGKGTRLREETEFRPKPMVPIGGYPILWHIMKGYAAQGHTEFVLCLGYKGEMIKDYFRNYFWNRCDVTLKLSGQSEATFHGHHDEEDWLVTLVDTGEETMTAYRVQMIKRFIPDGEPFLLTYGDGLADIDVEASIQAHRRAGKICTMTAVHPAGRFGNLRVGDDGSVFTFAEKPPKESAWINGGFMVCEPEMFRYLGHDVKMMLEREPMSRLVVDGQLNCYRHDGFWQPMDTYQEMQSLNGLWSSGKAPWKMW